MAAEAIAVSAAEAFKTAGESESEENGADVEAVLAGTTETAKGHINPTVDAAVIAGETKGAATIGAKAPAAIAHEN